MKNLYKALIGAALLAGNLAPAADAADFREHRALYVTPYLADWPSGGVNNSNAESYKRVLRQALDQFQQCGINVIYYHVRANCDAAYNSKYEPWMKGVVSTRGGTPAFDVFEYLVDECHSRGIEVYAWFNPYRYCGQYRHGESPLDYELTHPEWLIQQSQECILNPALEEVKQRIVDVILDCVGKYDIDGVIFDDYFYTNPTPMSLDADLYEAAKAADPSVGTQIQWRVKNVNSMIERVNNAVKEAKPWLVFGISPAGVASPSHVTSEYGLDPAPGGDWQYNAIASDPLSWYKNHYIDFMAPQIYWPGSTYDELEAWWSVAARKYNRHLYSAISLSSFTKYGGSEFVREIELSRELLPQNENGHSYFRMQSFRGNSVKYDGKTITFPEYLGKTIYQTQALTPIRPWHNVYAPAYVENLRREDNVLKWDAVEGMRYTVYAFNEGEELQPYNTNLQQVRYENSYEIPADKAGCTFGVAVYDRYGNEYPMATEGATRKEAAAPVLTYPAAGSNAAALFDFTWEATGADNIVEVALDPEFKEVIVQNTTHESFMNSFAMPSIEEGRTYYWRVRTNGVNSTVGVSEVRSFTASGISLLGPDSKEEETTPSVSWTPAYDGSVYTLEISRNSSFTLIDYTAEVADASHIVAEGHLLSGFHYYYRVTATRGGRSMTTATGSFWTKDVVPELPKFVNPAAEGTTLHADQTVEVAPVAGASSLLVQIATSADFSGRIYRVTLKDGETATPELSKIKVNGKSLEDGTTYYVRACSKYFIQANQSTEQSTDYATSAFVYSSANGVDDIYVNDGVPAINGGVLSMPVSGNLVEVFTAASVCVLRETNAPAEVDLNGLVAGVYVVKVSGQTPATIKFAK